LRRCLSADFIAAVIVLSFLFFITPCRASESSEAECHETLHENLSTISLPGHPFSIVSSPDGCLLFATLTGADAKTNGVAALRRAHGKFSLQNIYPVRKINSWNPLNWLHAPWPGPAGMAITHDGKTLIVANYPDCTILLLEVEAMKAGKGNPLIGRFTDVCSAGSLYVNVTNDDKLLFISDERSETISVFDLDKARAGNPDPLIGRITVGVSPVALSFSPDGRWLYTTSEVAPMHWGWPPACPAERQFLNRNHEGAVVIIDVKQAAKIPGDSIVATVPAGCSPVRLALTGEGSNLWVSARDSDKVLVFDTKKMISDPQNAKIGFVSTKSPVGIIALPGGRLAVANTYRGGKNIPDSPSTISLIDAGKKLVIGTIPAGLFAREFALSPDGKTLFLANYNSDSVSVIDLGSVDQLMK
jgi:DNA-binding beta-propeller fold protein YncE